MEKTKLGISLPLAGLIVVGAAYFGGYTALLLVAGYILLKEENRWLKRLTLTTLLVLICFSALSVLIHLIPDALDMLERLLNIFRADVLDSFFNVIGRIESFLSSVLSFANTLVFAGLGVCAFSMKNISISFVDKFLDKHF